MRLESYSQNQVPISGVNVLPLGPNVQQWQSTSTRQINPWVISEEIKHYQHPDHRLWENQNWGQSSKLLTDSGSFCFKAKPHLKQQEMDLFSYSSCHVATSNQAHRNNCMFPLVSLRPRRSAVPWDLMTVSIDPLHHHSALMNGFKMAISGIIQIILSF